jgi:hypothetical protein
MSCDHAQVLIRGGRGAPRIPPAGNADARQCMAHPSEGPHRPLRPGFPTSLGGCASMAGSAFSIDAVYGKVRDLLPIGARPTLSKGASRAAYIVETLKRALVIGHRTQHLQQAIPKLFELRDPAVHPDGAFNELVTHGCGLADVVWSRSGTRPLRRRLPST